MSVLEGDAKPLLVDMWDNNRLPGVPDQEVPASWAMKMVLLEDGLTGAPRHIGGLTSFLKGKAMFYPDQVPSPNAPIPLSELRSLACGADPSPGANDDLCRARPGGFGR